MEGYLETAEVCEAVNQDLLFGKVTRVINAGRVSVKIVLISFNGGGGDMELPAFDE